MPYYTAVYVFPLGYPQLLDMLCGNRPDSLANAGNGVYVPAIIGLIRRVAFEQLLRQPIKVRAVFTAGIYVS